MALLDELTYPWPEPSAQQLHRTLIALFPTNQAALLLAAEAGVDTGWIFQQQAVALLWKEVLDAAALAGMLHPLIRGVIDRVPPGSTATPFLRQLLDGEEPEVSAEPRAEDGTPAFLYADDAVGEPESMLFGDDLTIPIGRISGLIATLRKVLLVGPAVCKLTVGFGVGEQYGTAFRIGPDLLLTNWHVVHRRTDGLSAVTVNAEFGFEDDAELGQLDGRTVQCEPAAVESDRTDDWAVVRAHGALDNGWPLLPLFDLPFPTFKALRLSSSIRWGSGSGSASYETSSRTLTREWCTT